MTTIVLPFPVSVNGMFRNVRGVGRVPTRGYKGWKEDAGWTFLKQRVAPVSGPVAISMLVQDKGRGDLDNTAKCVLDFLVERGVIDGDSREIVRELHLYWSPEVRGCQVTINPAQQEA